MNFGTRIRELRKLKDISLRDFAERIEIDFTYLSKIENGKVYPPSEKKIVAMAKELNVSKEELLNLSGKVSAEGIRKAMEENPKVGILLRKIQSRELSKGQVEDMLKIVSDDEVGNE